MLDLILTIAIVIFHVTIQYKFSWGNHMNVVELSYIYGIQH